MISVYSPRPLICARHHFALAEGQNTRRNIELRPTLPTGVTPIQLHEIAVCDLVAGYEDKGDEGVVGYGGRLDIRLAYQREFA